MMDVSVRMAPSRFPVPGSAFEFLVKLGTGFSTWNSERGTRNSFLVEHIFMEENLAE
jgi:hypothetical protein